MPSCISSFRTRSSVLSVAWVQCPTSLLTPPLTSPWLLPPFYSHTSSSLKTEPESGWRSGGRPSGVRTWVQCPGQWAWEKRMKTSGLRTPLQSLWPRPLWHAMADLTSHYQLQKPQYPSTSSNPGSHKFSWGCLVFLKTTTVPSQNGLRSPSVSDTALHGPAQGCCATVSCSSDIHWLLHSRPVPDSSSQMPRDSGFSLPVACQDFLSPVAHKVYSVPLLKSLEVFLNVTAQDCSASLHFIQNSLEDICLTLSPARMRTRCIGPDFVTVPSLEQTCLGSQ